MALRLIILFIAIFFCKIGYMQEIQEVHTHYTDHLQKVIVLSRDTAYDGVKVITSNGVLYFWDESIDSAIAEKTTYIYHFEEKRMFKRTRFVKYVEVRQIVNIFSEQTDTIFNLFATENDNVLSDDFWAEVKTSYLINLLKQDELTVKSDSLWIVVVPEYVNNPSSQYYIYQYCENSQKLYLSVVSFAQEFSPRIVFSDSAQLNKKELKTLKMDISALDIPSQQNCLTEDNIFASFVYQSHGKNIGIFCSYNCDKSRVFNFAFPFVFIGTKYFKVKPKIFGSDF
jgi:hypothetical protein